MRTAEELIAWLDGRIKRYPLNEWLKETREFILNSNAASAPSVPEGWQLVPIEPTPQMNYAASETDAVCFDDDWKDTDKAIHNTFSTIYRAMLAAAPQPPKKED